MNFRIFIRFFTGWGFILQALYYLGFLKKYQFSLLLIVSLISVCGFIITYINPKKIVVPYFNIVLKGNLLKLFDILGHHIPLLIFIYNYNSNIEKDSLFFFASVLIIYLFLINPFLVYNFVCLK